MMDSLQKMGVEIRRNSNDQSVSISGTGGRLQSPAETIWVHQSGTTARFCLPLAALCGQEVTIDGDQQIRNRPHEGLCKALESLGAQIEYLEAANSFPLVVNGKNLKGGQITLNGSISSQFISALLLAAPCFPDQLELNIEGDLVSRPYIDMTISVMQAFGAQAERVNDRRYVISPSGITSKDGRSVLPQHRISSQRRQSLWQRHCRRYRKSIDSRRYRFCWHHEKMAPNTRLDHALSVTDLILSPVLMSL